MCKIDFIFDNFKIIKMTTDVEKLTRILAAPIANSLYFTLQERVMIPDITSMICSCFKENKIDNSSDFYSAIYKYIKKRLPSYIEQYHKYLSHGEPDFNGYLTALIYINKTHFENNTIISSVIANKLAGYFYIKLHGAISVENLTRMILNSYTSDVLTNRDFSRNLLDVIKKYLPDYSDQHHYESCRSVEDIITTLTCLHIDRDSL